MLWPLDRLRAVVRTLRSEGGCPWDRAQTHRTLREGLIEECYELIEAIDADDPEAIREELGDVLLQVFMHARIAEEAGNFDIVGVANSIAYKLISRHPHVFAPYPQRGGDERSVRLDTVADVLDHWQRAKAGEKPERESALDGVPAGLPALMRAEEVQKKAARVGFDWPDAAGVIDKVKEEIDEISRELASGDRARVEDEVGDLLFSAVNLARAAGVEAESALRHAAAKFERRFRAMEKAFKAQGLRMADCGIEQLEDAWREAKRAEDPAAASSRTSTQS